MLTLCDRCGNKTMLTEGETSMCTNCGYNPDAPQDTDNKLKRFLMVGVAFLVYLVLVLSVSRVDAQVDNVPACQGLPAFIQGEDMTAPMLESYTSTGQRRAELIEILHVEFSRSAHNGFYNWYGTWVIVNKLSDGRYRLWAGTDWTIGDDGQLHNPTCLMYVSDRYEWWFGMHDKRWYPTGEALDN